MGLDNPGVPTVQFVEGWPALDPDEPGVTWPGSAFSMMGLRSRMRAPAYFATRHLLRNIHDAWNDRTFWEPDALLAERAFYEAAALAAEVDRRPDPVEGIDVAPLLNALKKAGSIWTECPSKGRPFFWSPRSSPWQPAPSFTLSEWEETLAELRARSLDATTLHPPVVPPRHLILGSTATYSDAVRDELADWSLGYFRQTYETVHALLSINLPTSASAISLYRMFPLVITLVPQKDMAAGRSLILGEKWIWPSQDPNAPLVEVRLSEPGGDPQADALAAGAGWINSVWRVPHGDYMPLYDATYDAVGRRMEPFDVR